MTSGEVAPPTAPKDQCGPNRESKHLLDYFIFAFLVLTFLATAGAAYYTRKQWVTASDAERRQLRAYPHIDVKRTAYEADKRDFKALVQVYMKGQTPAIGINALARIAQICCSTTVYGWDVLDGDERGYRATKFKAFLFSANPFEIEVGDDNFPIRRGDFDSVKEGMGGWIMITGRISYRDVFGCNHWIRYCYA